MVQCQSIMIKNLKKNIYIKNFVSLFRNHKKIVFTLIIFGIISDVFFFTINSDIRLFGILGFYIISILLFKLTSKITFLICLFILFAMYVGFLFSGASIITEKIAVWFVLFLTVGIIQQWNEIS